MLRVQVNPNHPEPRKIGLAVAALDKGGVIAYPTDTVYGLGCALTDRKAIARIYELKQMDASRPLAFLLPDLSEIARFGIVGNGAYRLMRRLLPGPYTILLEATREVPRTLLHERDKRRTVGVRVPDHPVVRALLAAHGRPILSSSAVGEEGEMLGDADSVKARYERGLDVLVDDGEYTGTEPSTVISLMNDELEIVREGKGPTDHLPA